MTKTKSKNLFIFQTGHGKGLAKAEILTLLPGSIVDEVFDGFVVDAEQSEKSEQSTLLGVNPSGLLNKMGSIVRITRVLQSGPANMPLNFEQWISEAITGVATNDENTGRKIRYGLSMHPKSDKVLKKTLIGSKKNVQKSKVGNVRFVNKDFKNLSSVQAWHEHLLSENAIELHLFKSSEDRASGSDTPRWYLTRTLAIQDFEWYSHRDYDRPARSAKNGMFPPKLAQILINLANSEQRETYVFDPFCGSGTVLQEAILMGYMAWGSDISEQMVADSKENLEWLAEQPHAKSVLVREPNLKHTLIFTADATKLTADQIPPDCTIVTETWLGPILEKALSALELPKVQREIESLYEALFANLEKLCPGTTMVFTAPYHRNKAERQFLPNLPAILEKHCQIIPLSDHERPSLFYERKHQLVSREIWKVVIGE